MSSILFAGASQIAFAKLYLFASPITIITSVTAINLRHLLYGISVNEYLNHLSLKWRIILSYLLTDEAYAVSIIYFKNNYEKNIFIIIFLDQVNVICCMANFNNYRYFIW